MDSLLDLLTNAAARAAAHREGVAERPVFPSDVDLDAVRTALGSLAEGPTPAAEVIDEHPVGAVVPVKGTHGKTRSRTSPTTPKIS